MAITKQQKEEILAELKTKFSEAKSVAFGQYAGMSVDELQTMRRTMRDSNVEFKIAKKTLLKLAAKEQGLELLDEIVEGTVGAAFSYDDVVSGPKIIKTTSKKVNVLKLMGGVMDGAILSVEEMGELASLPSREQLLAKFMMMMRAPLQSFHGAVSSPLSTFARALDAYAEKAEAPAEAAEPKGEAKSEEAPASEETAQEAPKEDEKPAEEAPAEEAETPAEEPAEAEEAPAEESSEEESNES